MLSVDDGKVIHFPANKKKFEFDKEVATIFPNMAQRSIPMYAEAHRLHASMLREVLSQPIVRICDVGASRGDFFKEICNQFQINPKFGSASFDFTATDNSPHMLNYLKTEMPWVKTLVADAQSMDDLHEPQDVICLFYLLQFLQSSSEKLEVLQWAHRNLREGGILLLGQKVEITQTYHEMFTSEYIKFRMNNDYTLEEIQAKTEALKHSMWPSTPAWLEDLCAAAHFSDYVETTKWLQFSTSMCVR